MKQKERASIVRLALDIVKADSIIDVREIDFLNRIRMKYNIKREDEAMADFMTFASAISILKGMPQKQKQDICGAFKSIAFSDNVCSVEESMCILSIAACLLENTSDGVAEVYSVDLAGGTIFDRSQVLYIEGEYDSKVNAEIKFHYRDIVNELRLVGLKFVYVPKICEYYKSLSNEDLHALMRCIYPSISEFQLQRVASLIRVLSTAEFCKNDLSCCVNIKNIEISYPSIMLWFGKSFCQDKNYDNFLIISVEGDFLAFVRQFIDAYVSVLNSCVIGFPNVKKQRLVYSGFHKQILDSLVKVKGIRSSVVVDLVHRDILFPEIDKKITGLHRREKALYALFLLESSSGGINFKKPYGAKAQKRFERHMAAVQRKYEILYEEFGGEKGKAPQIALAQNRLPMISLIKKQILNLEKYLNVPNDYLIQRNIFGNYCVAISPELCKYFNPKTSEFSSFSESDFWRRLSAI